MMVHSCYSGQGSLEQSKEEEGNYFGHFLFQLQPPADLLLVGFDDILYMLFHEELEGIGGIAFDAGLSLLLILAILADGHRGGLDLLFVPASFVSLGTLVALVAPVLLGAPTQTLLDTGT